MASCAFLVYSILFLDNGHYPFYLWVGSRHLAAAVPLDSHADRVALVLRAVRRTRLSCHERLLCRLRPLCRAHLACRVCPPRHTRPLRLARSLSRARWLCRVCPPCYTRPLRHARSLCCTRLSHCVLIPPRDTGCLLSFPVLLVYERIRYLYDWGGLRNCGLHFIYQKKCVMYAVYAILLNTNRGL